MATKAVSSVVDAGHILVAGVCGGTGGCDAEPFPDEDFSESNKLVGSVVEVAVVGLCVVVVVAEWKAVGSRYR